MKTWLGKSKKMLGGWRSRSTSKKLREGVGGMDTARSGYEGSQPNSRLEKVQGIVSHHSGRMESA